MLLELNVLAIFNMLVLTMLLLVKKPSSTTNYVLAFVVLTPAFALLFNTLIYLDVIQNYPYCMVLSLGLNLLWAPAFYYYVLLMTGKQIRFRWIHVLHLIPFALSVLFFVWFFELGNTQQIDFFKRLKVGSPLPLLILNNLMIFQVFGYLAVSVSTIFRFNQQLKQSFSDIQRLSVRWLSEFIFFSVGLAFFAFVPILIDQKISTFLIFLPIASSLSYIFIVYKTMTRPVLFSHEVIRLVRLGPNIDMGSPDGSSKPEQTKLLSSQLSEQSLKEQANRLETFMAESRIYTDPELNIKKLADKLGMPSYILSQTINRYYGKNFFEFVNGYRVEEAKRMLMSPESSNLTIEAIAYECGFGSRATFYDTFKRITKQNPSAFKNAG